MNDTSRTCYTLRAERKEEITKWARCLQICTDLAKGGDGTQIISSIGPEIPKSKTSQAWESQLQQYTSAIEGLEAKVGSQHERTPITNGDHNNFGDYFDYRSNSSTRSDRSSYSCGSDKCGSGSETFHDESEEQGDMEDIDDVYEDGIKQVLSL